MQGEIVRFRKRFFGGFDRDDVVAYIAKLSQERDEGLTTTVAAKNEIIRLQGELGRLHKQLDLYEKVIEKMRIRAVRKPSQPPVALNASEPGLSKDSAKKSVIVIRRRKA